MQATYLRWNWKTFLMWKLLQWRLKAISGGQVMSGPFAGMKLIGTSLNSALFPKYLGIYERELHEVFFQICGTHHQLLINVGSGEGYYAVGLLRAEAARSAICFEKSAGAEDLIREFCLLNHITASRVQVFGFCTINELERALVDPLDVILVVDVEGYEAVLLDPIRVPALRHASILVETHDFLVDGLTQALRTRFEPSHQIQEISGASRTAKDAAIAGDWFINVLPKYVKGYLVTEFRPSAMKWLWMTPVT
jgi:hypothetical protein